MKTATLLLSIFFSVIATASTGFHIGNGFTSDLPSVYAISTGWYYPVQGAVTANPRNLAKTSLSTSVPSNQLAWVARYGSVSKTILGLEFPMSGVNEKGLVIQATVLNKQVYPPIPADGYGLHFLQWIQYHLDTSATVAEVIEKSVTLKAPAMPVGKYDIQYQVCDLKDCAVFSFFGSKAVAQGSIGTVTVDFAKGTAEKDLKPYYIAAIANYTYAESIAAFDQCKASPCTSQDNVIERFNKAAEMVLSFAGVKSTDFDRLLDDVMTKIKTVDQGLPLTTWNEAYLFHPQTGGPAKMLMTFKSPSLPVSDRQWIDFTREEFDCSKTVRMWWMDMTRGGGDQTGTVFDHNSYVQEKLARQHKSILSEAEILAVIDYPSQTKCLK